VKTKFIAVWHVEYCSQRPRVLVRKTYRAAQAAAKMLVSYECICIAITGPHQQEVPA
jgi:hypothetical protein